MIELADLADNLRRVTVEVMDGGTSLGAGVLWPRGCVVTNAHVARRSVMAVRLVDGRRLEGRLLARDGSADLACSAWPVWGCRRLPSPIWMRPGSARWWWPWATPSAFEAR